MGRWRDGLPLEPLRGWVGRGCDDAVDGVDVSGCCDDAAASLVGGTSRVVFLEGRGQSPRGGGVAPEG